MVLPTPIWPSEFSPQQTTESSELSFTIAQACLPPASIKLAFQEPILTVLTFTPISRYPSPLDPEPVNPTLFPSLSFSPQHLIELSLTNAQENVFPNATSMKVKSSPTSVKYRYLPISKLSSP